MESKDNSQNHTPDLKKLDNINVAAKGAFKLNVISIINPVLGWVVSHWKLALFLILCFIIFVQHELIKHYKLENSANTIEISTLKDNLKNANAALEDQNKKIQDAAKNSEDKKKQIDALTQQLKDKSVKDKQTIDALRNKPIGTTCQDAIKFLDDYIGANKWSN